MRDITARRTKQFTEAGLTLSDQNFGPIDTEPAVTIRRFTEVKFTDGLVVTTNEPVEPLPNGSMPLPAVDYSKVESMQVEYEIEWPENKIETIPVEPTTIHFLD